MSVVEYYLLKRFPVPYGKLFTDQQTLERAPKLEGYVN